MQDPVMVLAYETMSQLVAFYVSGLAVRLAIP